MEDFKKALEEADMVLVGLGEIFDGFTETGSMQDDISEKLEMTDYSWLVPAYRDVKRDVFHTEKVKKALEALADMLQGKNYFIISEAQNEQIFRTGWKDGRLVMPCGGAFEKQCSNWKKKQMEMDEQRVADGEEPATDQQIQECMPASLTPDDRERLADFFAGCGELFADDSEQEDESDNINLNDINSLPPEVQQMMKLIAAKSRAEKWNQKITKALDGSLLGKCECCGAPMILNVVQAPAYDERSWTEQWKRYTKWLQGTVNRKLLVLELGVGMQYPGMIRLPFEKVVFLNQKAVFYRIHSDLYQMTEKTAEKGVGISDNAIDWLLNLC